MRIAERCRFDLDELRYEYPAELVPEGETPASYLRKLTEAGLARRFPGGAPGSVRELVEHELALIAELALRALLSHRPRHRRGSRASENILCQGRGSAANSAVCYCLGITEVDPARMTMLFERFISRERNEPPDIDVDFEHQRREEVIQYVYREVRPRPRGDRRDRRSRYRPRSAVRDVGKALGLELGAGRPPREIARLVGQPLRDHPNELREGGFDPDEPGHAAARSSSSTTLVGFPRHLSQHVGGFVISRGPLAELVPIENAAMPERSVIQWDKDDLEALGSAEGRRARARHALGDPPRARADRRRARRAARRCRAIVDRPEDPASVTR